MSGIVRCQNSETVKKDINLLLLGPTGAGKSTFINALANYLTYESLEDALQGTSVNLIPFRFPNFIDKHHKVSWIELGTKDDNENLETGKSATQGPRTYVFETPDINLHCIDTPGSGDVEGEAQDEENFKLTMKHLTTLDQLHGICIFIDRGSSRLHQYFVSCIDRLFKHLHEDAGKNIVFLFSKSSTENQTANSYSTLEQLIEDNEYKSISLKPETAYHVENEAIQLLAKHVNGISLNQKEKSDCVNYWTESVKQISCLLGYVSSMQPHNIDNTVFLNKVRTTVIALIDPMLNIIENDEKNIEILVQKKENVNEAETNFNVPKIVLKPKRVNPRMICTSSKCVKVETIDGARIDKNYAVCHDDCYIRGLKFLSKITFLNRYCEIMEGGRCTKCKCSWKVHKNVTWVFEENVVVEETIDDDGDSTPTSNAATDLEDVIRQLEENIKGYRDDKEKIIDVAVKLGIFLDQTTIKRNQNELEHQIKNTISLEREAGREVNVKSLQSLLQEYEEQRKYLQSMKIKVSATYASSLINSLNSLPLNGAVIADCLKTIQSEDSGLNLGKKIVLKCPRAISDL